MSVKCLNNKECFITGYQVMVEAGPEEGTVQFSLIDPCNTLHDSCRAKRYLMKVYTDWLESLSESTEVYATCNRCPQGGPGLTFYNRAYVLVVKTDVPAPSEPVVVTYPLPQTCDNVFDALGDEPKAVTQPKA